MVTQTPNYAFNLPGVNDPADANIWGTELNNNFSNLDTDLKTVSDVANTGAPLIGEMRIKAGQTIPTGWLLCYGQAVSRATYSALFSEIGIAWGAGDLSTTFNVPDMRGRAPFGVDNMGGSSANRVTFAGSGITGSTLGSVGGDQLTQQHTHVATSPVTDPGHVHYYHGNSAPTGAAASIGTTNISGTDKPADGFVRSATTGVTVAVTNADFGAGAGQNMPPAAMCYYVIYSGV